MQIMGAPASVWVPLMVVLLWVPAAYVFGAWLERRENVVHDQVSVPPVAEWHFSKAACQPIAAISELSPGQTILRFGQAEPGRALARVIQLRGTCMLVANRVAAWIVHADELAHWMLSDAPVEPVQTVWPYGVTHSGSPTSQRDRMSLTNR